MTRRPSRTLKSKTLTTQVTAGEQQYLDSLSRLSGLSMSALLCEIVRGFMKGTDPRELRKGLEESHG